jgi:hypothetical protein
MEGGTTSGGVTNHSRYAGDIGEAMEQRPRIVTQPIIVKVTVTWFVGIAMDGLRRLKKGKLETRFWEWL